MKIITKSNFNKELYEEIVIAENVNKIYGKELVDLHNKAYLDEFSEEYLALVEDDYELYDGYKVIYEEVE